MSGRRRSDSGFTLIEIVVGMLLMAIAFALCAPVLANLFGNMSRSTSTGVAQSASSTALRMVGNDIQQALADRPTGDNSAANISQALSDTDPRRHDIVVAGRTTLGLWADVVDERVVSGATGPEYVKWALQVDQPICGTSVPNWCVTRKVWNSDMSLVLTNEVVVSGTGDAPADTYCAPGVGNLDSVPRLFCYRRSVDVGSVLNPGIKTNGALDTRNYDWNDAQRSNKCTQIWSDATGVVGVDPPSLLSVGGLGMFPMQRGALEAPSFMLAFRDTITSIAVVMPSHSGRGAQWEESTDYGEFSIDSRQTPMYRAAIMCGSR